MKGETSQIKIVSNDNSLTEETKEMTLENSFIKVVFKDEQFYKKYSSKFEQFFKKIFEDEKNHDSEQPFNIDKTDNELNTDGGIPVYSSNYEDVLQLPEPQVQEDVEENIKKPPAMTCFNCLGDHHMKDCTERLDRQRIAANRKNLTVGNTSRYHVEERKNAIEPGCPSVELRKALGLKADQLPRYIYCMRVIGYPPGWMQEAVFESSGLSLYDDSNGNSISVDESLTEENDRTRYDSEKFVNYPGFNSPVPDGFKDEWHALGLLPIQQHQQLSEALKSGNTMSSKNMYKRRQLQLPPNNEDIKKSKSGLNECGEETKSEWSPEQNSTPKQITNTNKRKPLQLPPPINGDTKKSKNESGIKESEEERKSHWSPEESSTPKQIKRDTQLDPSNFESPILQKNLSSSLSQSPGTPIVNQNNPFFKLPSSDKFSQDITEHLPFENLPDAVGKFENFRNVLSGVQKKLQEINKS